MFPWSARSYTCWHLISSFPLLSPQHPLLLPYWLSSVPQTLPGTLAQGHFQILLQGRGTQAEPRKLPELRKCS